MSMHVRSGYSCSKSDFPEIMTFVKRLITTPGHLLRGILIGKCTKWYIVFSIHLHHSLQERESTIGRLHVEQNFE